MEKEKKKEKEGRMEGKKRRKEKKKGMGRQGKILRLLFEVE